MRIAYLTLRYPSSQMKSTFNEKANYQLGGSSSAASNKTKLINKQLISQLMTRDIAKYQ